MLVFWAPTLGTLVRLTVEDRYGEVRMAVSGVYGWERCLAYNRVKIGVCLCCGTSGRLWPKLVLLVCVAHLRLGLPYEG